MKAIYENQSSYELIPLNAIKMQNLNFLAHWHVDVEFMLVLEGSLQVGIDTERRTLHAGDIAICGSNSMHYYTSESANSVILIKFLPDSIDNQGTWQKNMLCPFVEKKSILQTGDQGQKLYDEIAALFHCLYNEVTRQEDYYKLYIQGKFLELCGLFLRHLPRQEGDRKLENSSPSIQLIKDSLLFIEENYMNHISLDEIAGKMNVSPYYYSRIFNKVMGMNLKTYQNILRINKAKDMIISDEMPIAEIAYECGFNSVRTFNRFFRLAKGYTPSHLRKTLYH